MTFSLFFAFCLLLCQYLPSLLARLKNQFTYAQGRIRRFGKFLKENLIKCHLHLEVEKVCSWRRAEHFREPEGATLPCPPVPGSHPIPEISLMYNQTSILTYGWVCNESHCRITGMGCSTFLSPT